MGQRLLQRIVTALIAVFLLLPLFGNAGATAQGTKNIEVMTTTTNGAPFLAACYELVGYSNIGCDENGDGKVTFDAIPAGTYTLRQTEDLGTLRMVGSGTNERTIEVNAEGINPQPFPVQLMDIGTGTNVAIITRNPESGELLTGACYQLLDYSNIGCDENSDGQVDFASIPYGTYAVRQTTAPSGYRAINDYQISVIALPYPGTGSQRIVLAQQPTQDNNVSVILLDRARQSRLTGAKNCLQLVGQSQVGCDIDIADGQIDFVNVSEGNNAIATESLTCPYTPSTIVGDWPTFSYGSQNTVIVVYVDYVAGYQCP